VITFARLIKYSNLQMDIVDRLKEFINYLAIPVTKFADNCGIPRPTLSQLTNGRNKSVRNELIEKIHTAYPNLNTLWLMFGEGDMLLNKNIQTSEPQNTGSIDFGVSQSAISELDMPRLNFEGETEENNPEIYTTTDRIPSMSAGESINFSAPKNPDSISSAVTITPDNSKRVVNIIVYYNDNTFESFSPASTK